MSNGRHYVVVGNIVAADSCLRLGAKVVVLSIPGNPAHVFVRGCSRSGRVIDKWTLAKRLGNLRVKWAHAPDWMAFATKEEAEAFASRLGR